MKELIDWGKEQNAIDKFKKASSELEKKVKSAE